jgi:hypothetical protein
VIQGGYVELCRQTEDRFPLNKTSAPGAARTAAEGMPMLHGTVDSEPTKTNPHGGKVVFTPRKQRVKDTTRPMTHDRLTLVVMAAGYLRPGRTRLRYGMPPVMHCSEARRRRACSVSTAGSHWLVERSGFPSPFDT